MILHLCMLLLPQQPAVTDWFAVERRGSGVERGGERGVERGVERGGERGGERGVVVSAHRAEAPAETALRELARSMGWRFEAESKSFRTARQPVLLGLEFERQDPRMVAQWIAAAADADVVFRTEGGRVVMRWEASPAGEAAAHRAVRFYREALDAGALRSPGGARFTALLDLGAALTEVGDLEGAVAAFDRVFEEDVSRDFARRALRSSIRAHLILAKRTDLPHLKRSAHLHLAEQAARRGMLVSSADGRTAAACRLGEVLVQMGRIDECVELLEPEVAGAGTVRAADAHLLLAECYLATARPRRVIETLDGLARLARAVEGSNRELAQCRRFYYLHGMAAAALGEDARLAAADRGRWREHAMRSLETFLGLPESQSGPRAKRPPGAKPDLLSESGRASMQESDSVEAARRRDRALVSLGRAYFASDRFVEARVAVGTALRHERRLERRLAGAAHVLKARLDLLSGDGEATLRRLERLVRAEPQDAPALVLFVADTLLERGRPERVAAVVAGLREVRSADGEAARLRGLRAEFEIARRAGDPQRLESFVARATTEAEKLREAAIRTQISDLVGEAFAVLGEFSRAADAANGARRGLRALFRAGRFAEALARSDELAEDPATGLVELFYLARCHEEQHRATLRVADSHAARHLQRAHDLYTRIERRDVAPSPDGEPIPGEWAKAARAARRMMEWTDEHSGWRPLQIRVPAGPAK